MSKKTASTALSLIIRTHYSKIQQHVNNVLLYFGIITQFSCLIPNPGGPSINSGARFVLIISVISEISVGKSRPRVKRVDKAATTLGAVTTTPVNRGLSLSPVHYKPKHLEGIAKNFRGVFQAWSVCTCYLPSPISHAIIAATRGSRAHIFMLST